MKRVLGLALIATNTLLIMSCNSGEANKQASSQVTDAAHTNGQEHTYACPMHPEVTGKAGDKCPKCGMTLEATTTAPTTAGSYYMQFNSTPGTIAPNKEAVLSFTPKKKEAGDATVELETAHEKKMHLILVSDDLSWFNHVHPEASANGTYIVKTSFPTSGKFKAYADYKPTGSAQVVDKFDISVEGASPVAKKFGEEKLSGSSGNYTFTLTKAGSQLQTGAATQMEGVIKKDGKLVDANTLADYLGAKAHIVVISLNEKEYLHVHPEVRNGKFAIHTTFEKPGIYRGWIQFNGADKLHTIDFTFDVQEGKTGPKKETEVHTSAGGHDHTGHSH